MTEPNTRPDEPVLSEYRDDADMAELVELFVSEMPERLQTLADAYKAGNLSVLRVESHRLRGAAAGYGYPVLTDAAAQLEDAINAQQALESIQSEFASLISLCQRVR